MCSSMNASNRACSARTRSEYAKSITRSSALLEAFDLLPRELRERTRDAAGLVGVGVRRVALQRAGIDTLQDRGDAEHVVREVILPVAPGNAIAAGAPAVRSDIFLFG